MRRAARIDANQNGIVAALRARDATVQILSRVGEGCPDLLIGFRGRYLWLAEVKDGAKRPSKRKLTPDQVMWQAAWLGPPVVRLESIADALALLQSVA